MEGAIELAEEIFNVPVRLGIPQYVGGLSDVVRNPIHATGVGLLLYGKETVQARADRSVASVGMPGVFQRMKNWFQGNF